MRIVIKFFTACVFMLFLIAGTAFADDEDTRDKHKITKGTLGEKQAESVSSFTDKLSYNAYMGALEGYDNNVYLDPSRKGDIFDQVMADIVLRYRVNNKLDIKTRYDFTSITYHRFTDVSMLDNQVSAGLEYYPFNRLKAEAGYIIDFIDYFKSKDSDYMMDGPYAGIRYYINRKAFIGTMYQYSEYDYSSRKTRDNSAVETDITRKDKRNSLTAEIGSYLGKLFVKIKNTYFWNDSNDQYLDFYDYNSERINLYAAYPVTDKVSAILSGGYQRKDFKNRTTIKDPGKKENDNIMMLGAGFSYSIMPSCSVSFNYSYRQNYSNDPVQEYSGSIGTIGLNLSF
jgi:hypothetical protein